MRRILGRRVIRELRAHVFRYIALGLLIVLAIYVIVSLIGAADTIIITGTEHTRQNRIEDGQFTVFVPLPEQDLIFLNEKGAETEPMFYLDHILPDKSVLRVFRVRQSIDLIELETGAFPTDETGIVLEKRYCEEKSLRPGDSITIAGKELTVTGIDTSPDYEGMFRSMGDSTADSANFGTAFVTPLLYEELKAAGNSLSTEEYLYAYRLNGGLSHEELKSLLKTFSFDPDRVTDPDFREYWERIYGKRDDLLNGARDLADGSAQMDEALTLLQDQLDGAPAMLRNLLPSELLNNIRDLKKSGTDMAEGSAAMNESISELLDRFWKVERANLRSFVKAEDNPRIGAAKDDVQINKYAAILAGVIVLALIAYVISVFVIHGIEEERGVIGTLYALGVRRNELLFHYLVLPFLISLIAGIIGTVLGYSRFGVPVQSADTYSYFSVPTIRTKIEAWVIIYGTVLPPLIAALVNWVLIRKKLSEPAIQMIRKAEKRTEHTGPDLKNMSYIRRFQIRQLLREGRSAAAVVLSIFVCLLLMMLGVNAYVLCVHVGQDNVTDTRYAFMYLFKYPPESVPEGGYPAYTESFKKEVLGYNLDVTLMGLEPGNPFFDAAPKPGSSSVQISSAMAQKFGIKAGEAFFVSDPQNDRTYAFTAEDIVNYAPAFYIFMDIDSMRDLFSREDDYFNVVFSDHDLGIDAGKLYSVNTRTDVEKAANIFVELMSRLVYTMIGSSVLIMAIVMYLMLKVMIDHAAPGIALFKVFGYRKRELDTLFLNGNTILITVGTLAAIPLSKVIMDAMYPYLVSNVACAIDLRFEPWMYGAIFAGTMLIFLLIHTLLVRRLDKIEMNVILKNRE